MSRGWFLLCAAFLLLAACGQRAATRSTAPPIAFGGPPGRLVDIGGGRRLFAHCTGAGSPAVVLESGAGADSTEWRAVQPALSRTTRVCAYDRAGTGSSVAPPGVRDGRDEIADLDRLLPRLGLRPPYVLVGHSFGGVLARAYAAAHPDRTAGLVLVDSIGVRGRSRQLAIWPRNDAPERRRPLATTVLDGIDLAASEALADRTTTLGAVPLVVVAAGREDAFPTSPAPLGRALRRLWSRMERELAALSTNSVHAVAPRSDHDVPSPQTGRPEVVVAAVRAVLRAVRDRTLLPSCERAFAGVDVRCGA